MKQPQLTPQQVHQHLLLFEECRFRVICPPNGEYFKPDWNGVTTDIRSAGRYTAVQISNLPNDGNLTVEVVGGETEPIPEDGRVFLAFAQAKFHYAKLGGRAECRWIIKLGKQDKYYAKNPLRYGLTGLREEGWLTMLYNLVHVNGRSTLIDFEDQDKARELVDLPYRKCSLEQMLHPTLIAALKAKPNHPVYRALVMQATKQMPPEDLTTFEGLQDWVEYNIEYETEMHSP